MKNMMIGAALIGCAITLQLNAQQPTGDTGPAYKQAPATTEARPSVSAQTSSTQAEEVRSTFYLGPKMNELPLAVQDTVKNQARGQAIDDIDRETWNGRVVYEVEFKQEGGDRRVHIAEDGSLVDVNEAAGAERSNTERTRPDIYVPVIP